MLKSPAIKISQREAAKSERKVKKSSSKDDSGDDGGRYMTRSLQEEDPTESNAPTDSKDEKLGNIKEEIFK